MRHSAIRLAAALGLAAISMPQAAAADRHTCNQLRISVERSVPPSVRNLPYDQLDCAGISEVYLLLMRIEYDTMREAMQIEAVFRRYGLVD
ncbi:hypothetical protein P6F26_17885 [Roseibacterium sp. SDUM158017]|uniref:hypothetical protein n=1 Tax=Roseicyclus salinarum TaxID=3036773 RepID=UPI00241532E9|nr:hypothetical protein [Roseibacterium sp. SDUM158017]MDG4650321.1 hypothetical protein [Roseibacterium sp. SDUM158017]